MTAAVAVTPSHMAPPNTGGATPAAGASGASVSTGGADPAAVAGAATGFNALLALVAPEGATDPATADPASAKPAASDKTGADADPAATAQTPDAASALASLMLLIAPPAQGAPAAAAAPAPPAAGGSPSKPGATILTLDPKAALPTANDNVQTAALDTGAQAADPNADAATTTAARLAGAAVAAAQAQTSHSRPASAPAPASTTTTAPQATADTGKAGTTILIGASQSSGDGAQTQADASGDHPERNPDAKSDAAAAPDTTAPQVESQTAAGLAAQTAQTVKATPQTVTHLAAQIVSKAGQGGKVTQFDVTLDPQGLGQVTVQLRIAADGALSAAMRFDTPQAAAELRARSDELHRALTQAGFQLQDGALSFDVAGDGRQGGSQRGRDQGLLDLSARALRAAATLSTDGAPSAIQLIAATRASRAGGVDIRI